jgi:hypothetical protein
MDKESYERDGGAFWEKDKIKYELFILSTIQSLSLVSDFCVEERKKSLERVKE